MFIPNLIGLAITFVILLFLKPIIDHLGESKREDWADKSVYEKVKDT